MKKRDKYPYNFEGFFNWFCKPELFEELQGDLEENYLNNVAEKGSQKAAWIYRKEIIMLFRPSVIRNIQAVSFQIVSISIFLNYIKTALRSIKKSALFSGINIVGLSLSMAVGLLVISGIAYQYTFDQFHEKKDIIYRVITNVSDNYFGTNTYATAPVELAFDLKEESNSIEKIIRIQSDFGGNAKTESKSLLLDGLYADADFFQMFSFELTEGNARTALQQPFSIVLTQQTAERFFDDEESPIGKAIEIENVGMFQVTGIMRDIPSNSHLQFSSLASFSTLESSLNQNQSSDLRPYENLNNSYIYVLSEEGSNLDLIQSRLSTIAGNVNTRVENKVYSYELQSLSSILPGRSMNNQIGPEMERIVLIIFSILAAVIIISTCFNYTNLSLARALGRTKEIAVRKTLGGSRFQVFLQFVVESIVISILALLIAILIFSTLKPYLLTIDASIRDTFSFEVTPLISLYFFLFAVLVGIIAGFLPALVLSKQKVLKLFKSGQQFRFLGFLNLRKSLIIFQFTLSLICIITASVLIKQFRFSINFDMGFDRTELLYIQLNGTDENIIRNEFSTIPEVTNISMSSGYLGVGARSKYWIQNESISDSVIVDFLSIDHQYIPNHDIPLIAGNNFSEFDYEGSDELIIVNEEFLKEFQLGGPGEAIGKEVTSPNNTLFRIIGVTSNFNYDRLRNPIGSFFFTYQPEYFQYANLKMVSTDIFSSMDKIEEVWGRVNEFYDLEALFYDERVEEAYSFYTIAFGVIGFVTLLTILIACMGLLGIVIYTSKSRMKEVAIRKVLGAQETGLVLLLSKNFVAMMLWATGISVVVTYLFFNFAVLSREAYKAELGFWDFGIGIIIILTLGLIAITSQTLQVARSNPIDSIQNE